MSKVLIYLHGLGSVGDTDKSRALRDALEPLGVKVIAPDLPINPVDVVALVKELVEDIHSKGLTLLAFCGTSLGGFYSSYFGEIYDAPYVIVNPANLPSNSFVSYIDGLKNYKTGELLNITKETLEQFATLESEILVPTGSLATVFVAEDDSVVPCKYAIDRFKYARSLIVTVDGGHRYESKWDSVINSVKSLFS